MARVNDTSGTPEPSPLRSRPLRRRGPQADTARGAASARTDAVGRILSVDESAADLMGYSTRALAGRDLLAFVVTDRPDLAARLMEAAAGEPVTRETRIMPRNGRRRYVQVTIRRASPPGVRVELHWEITPLD